MGNQFMNHFWTRDISNWGKKTKAIWSYSPNGVLVVFIHGFSSDSLGAWYDFQSLIRSSREFSSVDTIFYGYESVYRSVNITSSELYKFINRIISNPPQIFSESFHQPIFRDVSFRYKKIIFIAHSLGAIICRKCLLEAYNNKEKWLGFSKIILFAPAHRGARLLFGLIPLPLTFLLPYRYFGVTIDEALPQSPIIQSLTDETNRLLVIGRGQFTKAHKVIWAGKERIVYNERFCQDPKAVVFEEITHTKVCKPNQKFKRPFNILRRALK